MKLNRNNFKTFLVCLSIICFLMNCGSSDSYTSNDQIVNSTSSLDNDVLGTKIFGIEGEDIELREGPGKKFDKIINQKATEALHRTQYLKIDYSCKVREAEEKDGWSKIAVVEPDWLTNSHQGWIETKHIINTTEQVAKSNAYRKKALFNEISQVQSKLSDVGIGELREWHTDGTGWFSLSSYYSFGSESSKNGMQNNLAYYLESKNENYIETVKLVLNINNNSERSQALSLLEKISEKTFSALSLKQPNGLSSSISSGRNFTSDNSDFKVSLTLDKSKIDTWKLDLEAK